MMAALALVVARWPALLAEGRATAPESDLAIQLPDRLSDGWQADSTDLSSWRPIYVGASAELQRTYASHGGRVWAHLAYYRHESEAGKLVSSVNVLVPMQGGEWKQVAAGRQTAALSGGPTHWRTAELEPVRSMVVGGPRLTVWKAYWIGGRLIDGDIEAKLWQAWLRLRGEPGDGVAIVLAAAEANVGASQRLLRQFTAANLDLLSRELAESRTRSAGRTPASNVSKGG